MSGEVSVRDPAGGDPLTDDILAGRTAGASAGASADAPVRATRAPAHAERLRRRSARTMQRLRTDPDTVERDLVKLVLTLVELVRQLMERQALRRAEGGDLTDEQIERLGLALMRLDKAMTRLKDHFDLSDGDLNLDLGPLGPLLPERPPLTRRRVSGPARGTRRTRPVGEVGAGGGLQQVDGLGADAAADLQDAGAGRVGGAGLPAGGVLAADLHVSRGVVTDAYQRLIDDGDLAGRGRAGTIVVAAPLTAPPPPSPAPGRPGRPEPPRTVFADRPGAEAFDVLRAAPARIDLSPGVPDLAAFPRAAWLRAERRVLSTLSAPSFGYGDSRGTPALRTAVAGWLARNRGIRADPADIVIVAGTAQALGLLAQVLRDDGLGTIAVEDPGSLGTRQHLRHQGMRTPPVPAGSHAASSSASHNSRYGPGTATRSRWRPRCTTRPRSITTTSSAASSAASRCVTSSSVPPPGAASRSRVTASAITGSSASAGSSSTSTGGSASSARASSSRCRCPPDNPCPPVPIGVSHPSGSPSTTSRNRARRAAASTSPSAAPGRASSRFARTDPANTCASCINPRTAPHPSPSPSP
ncbi:aminotransferase class I/II-fold pyridoxal phosphate-dependent enzyme [Actinomadura sp. LD22]|uniref:Aminotransferase class I/II-fold pyridoxal phosphate-dependent enzyme n=1 Tax=Actinomadura physcomitrii TaxID=2650748 RepID=A0A6I4MUH5_9ACTN|nr:aminotransferase class I/II-fold pyridoxal phosphate-dependent enzyme [Actinomadura physcomitrii]